MKYSRQIPVHLRRLMEHSGSAKKLIDLRKVFREKNPKLYRFLPGFIISWLRRVIHEDDVNAFIKEFGHHSGMEFVDDIVSNFGARITFTGLENVPAAGGLIGVSNHPLGALDAMTLLHVAGKKRKDIKFLVNDILMNLENLRELFLPVNTLGRNQAEHLAMIDKAYASEELVLVFPAGLVSRKRKGLIRDLDWKKSFITKSKQHRKNVLPIHISGRNRHFFYDLSNFRKKIGIKANIEMLWLVDEMYKQKGKEIHITIGKPIPWEVFDNTHSPHHWANKVRHFVYSLSTQPEAEFDPSYPGS